MSTTKNDLLVKNLIEFGFSEKEARIYITLLELEVATANEIAKAANINRSSTYVVLEGLKNKGFVGLSNDKKVQGYVAVSPDVILETLEGNIKKQNILKDKIKNIIPDLKGLDKNSKKHPVVKMFTGKAGLKTMLFDLFSTNTQHLREYGNYDNLLIDFPDYSDKMAQFTNKKDMRSSRIESKNNSNQFINISIYGNKIKFYSTSTKKDFFGVIIEDAATANTMAYLYDLAHKQHKKLS